MFIVKKTKRIASFTFIPFLFCSGVWPKAFFQNLEYITGTKHGMKLNILAHNSDSLKKKKSPIYKLKGNQNFDVVLIIFLLSHSLFISYVVWLSHRLINVNGRIFNKHIRNKNKYLHFFLIIRAKWNHSFWPNYILINRHVLYPTLKQNHNSKRPLSPTFFDMTTERP